jgi:hypothetical protein
MSKLQLSVDQNTIAFHRLDNGTKLLTTKELALSLEQAEQRANIEAQRAESLADQLRQLGIDPENP